MIQVAGLRSCIGAGAVAPVPVVADDVLRTQVGTLSRGGVIGDERILVAPEDLEHRVRGLPIRWCVRRHRSVTWTICSPRQVAELRVAELPSGPDLGRERDGAAVGQGSIAAVYDVSGPVRRRLEQYARRRPF